jgi:hypothetical protein
MTTTSDPTPITPDLEQDLRALTTWPGEDTALWKAALNSHAADRSKRWSRNSILRVALATVSVAAILLIGVGLFLPELGKARSSAGFVGQVAFEGDGTTTVHASPATISASEMRESLAGRASPDRPAENADRVGMSFDPVAAPSADSPARSVIRKSTIELAVPNTREAFAKIQHLLRTDLSEFIEASTLTGQDKEAHAQLTLRVAATGPRLDEVLNTLRTLGKVDSENSTGDDVTAQSVDLDARLRNEKQVETELLRLLESRGGKDAQLKDILELREKLSTVRQSIERLQGQRDTLARQVALASILVILRPADAPKPEPKPASIFDGFTNEMSTAWTSGLTALTQTLAFLIRILIGGLIWWLLLIAAIAIARRAIRRLIPDPARVPVAA